MKTLTLRASKSRKQTAKLNKTIVSMMLLYSLILALPGCTLLSRSPRLVDCKLRSQELTELQNAAILNYSFLLKVSSVRTKKGGFKNDFTGFVLPVYGNWCGPGYPPNGENPDPVDKLDAVCKEHDLCYETLGYLSCACDQLLLESLERAIQSRQDYSACTTHGKEMEVQNKIFQLIAGYFKTSACKRGCKEFGDTKVCDASIGNKIRAYDTPGLVREDTLLWIQQLEAELKGNTKNIERIDREMVHEDEDSK